MEDTETVEAETADTVEEGVEEDPEEEGRMGMEGMRTMEEERGTTAGMDTVEEEGSMRRTRRE